MDTGTGTVRVNSPLRFRFIISCKRTDNFIWYIRNKHVSLTRTGAFSLFWKKWLNVTIQRVKSSIDSSRRNRDTRQTESSLIPSRLGKRQLQQAYHLFLTSFKNDYLQFVFADNVLRNRETYSKGLSTLRYGFLVWICLDTSSFFFNFSNIKLG